METNLDEIEEIPEGTKELSKSIKAIGKDTVHKICSGQVVLSLAIAVKELVENAIDAGATLIEVKLKEQGLESVEVVDNGSGVEECNLEGMTAKYHTSKLREFSDLESVETFGFRGEALSSLCALSDMVIVTRHASSEVGIKLELDHNGQHKKKTPCARQIGTTVTLSNLFATLPVRKREFSKNIRKEFTKMCQILQAYCLVTKGVRIICTNHNSKGVKTTILSTHGSLSTRENIQAIFGTRQSTDLVEMQPPINIEEKFTKESLMELQDPNSSLEVKPEDIDKLNLSRFKIDGWISSCSHGSGRSSRDRQYFFINSRPCEPKNIIKIVNEVYHRYNVQQYPFIFLNILIERSDVDVNLTPDKRQLLVNNEKILLLAIKMSLMKTFGNIPSTFKIQNTLSASTLKQELNPQNVDSDDEILVQSQGKKFMEALSQWKTTGATGEAINVAKTNKRKPTEQIMATNFKLKKIHEYLSQESTVKSNSVEDNFMNYRSDPESDSEDKLISPDNMSINMNHLEKESKEFDELTQLKTLNPTPEEITQRSPTSIDEENDTCLLTNDNIPDWIEKIKTETLQSKTSSAGITEHRIDCKVKQSFDSPKLITEKRPSTPIITDITIDIEDSDTKSTPEYSEVICTSIEEISKLVLQEECIKETSKSRSHIERLKFKAEINPNKNKNAEEELQREITKDMFAKMDIIGQFNLGFIIVKLDDDLFIVDQHATDEKYNFEDLQKTTILQNQPLTVPQSLELTAVNEMILMDNLNVFEANGFKFKIDENAPVTKKVKLSAKPFSKNWEFDKNDIDELIFMLQDAPPNTLCRPSRIRAMFASRACRKSVMIGHALNMSVMKKLITHMGEIEQPWNCPHGRPTMRHLINLAMLEENK